MIIRMVVLLSVFLTITAAASASFADELCSIQVKQRIYSKDGELLRLWGYDRPKGTFVKTWEDCYQKALNETKKYNLNYNETTTYQIVSDSGIKTFNRALVHVSIQWSFNDGYIMDSSGEVTQNSTELPAVGDRRVDVNGYFYAN
jgi:hypothetical protein